MSEIYLVLAVTDHEGSNHVKSFVKESDARSFINELMLAKRCEPKYESPMTDEEFTEFDKRVQSWRELHPAPESTYADHYDYTAIELVREVKS